MARKQLIRGENAKRVVDRIAKAPEDLGTGTGIFALVRDEAGSLTPDVADRPIAPTAEPPRTVRSTQRRSAAKSARTPAPPTTIPAPSAESSSKREIFFTKREREIIARSCQAFRNSLPIYLKSVQDDVRAIDSVLRKIED